MHFYIMIKSFSIIWILTLTSLSVYAQTDSILQADIEPIQVTALRLNTDLLSAPVSINIHDVTTLQGISQQLSLQDYMVNSAGVFMMNANNYAQDLRISIRGYGARAAFGIRGIKLIVDGIPETTPDGQGQVDNLVLNQIKKIEVLKGPSSSIYGNASGGVILINSFDDFVKNYVEGSATLGAYGMSQYTLSGGWKNEHSKIILNMGRIATSGYRAQSGFESQNISGRVEQKVNKKTKLLLQMNYTNSPTADDPGSLDADAAEADRRQARDRNIEFATGESISQIKFGAHLDSQLKDNLSLEAYGFWSDRNFTGLLPFEFGAWINLDRQYWGIGASINNVLAKDNTILKSKVGIDIARQSDQRDRYRNLKGIQGGQTLSQLETFENIGLYYTSAWQLKKWQISAGLRWDLNHLAAADAFLSNGDDSGDRQLSALSSSISIAYRVNDHQRVYGSYRIGYETPSLSELSANPTGQAGFNDQLEFQESENFEIGWKSVYQQWQVDVVLYHINTKNELVPYELEAFPDRTFFRNAGSGDRSGLELSASYHITEQLDIAGSYSYADLRYADFIAGESDFSGNVLPGIPQQFGGIQFTYAGKAVSAQLSGQFIGELYADDANNVSVPGYNMLNLKVGYKLQAGSITWSPFFGINNMLDVIYNDNVRINAFGRRYFEPGPERHIYGGLRIKL